MLCFRTTFLVSLTTIFLLAGCGKTYRTPQLPKPTSVAKVFENDEILVEQAHLMPKDITLALNDSPEDLAATAFSIKNKSSNPVTVEIAHANVSTYDAEDVAVIFSKVALQDPTIKELVVGHTISQGLVIGVSGLLSASVVYTVFNTLKKAHFFVNANRVYPSYWLLGGLSLLATLPVIALGTLAYYAIKTDKEDILDNEQEQLINKFRTMFEPTVLAFEDSVEVPPRKTMDQMIFFNTKPAVSQEALQRELVLRCVIGDKKIQIPLEV